MVKAFDLEVEQKNTFKPWKREKSQTLSMCVLFVCDARRGSDERIQGRAFPDG